MIEWGQKSNPQKSLGLPTKPKKPLDQKLTPKNSHAEFLSLKNFQKGLNDKTRNTVCVCLYSSCRLMLPFPHLVVILTTRGTPKNNFCFNCNIMNDNSKQDHLSKNKFDCTLFAELCGRDTRALPQIFRLF